MKSLVKGTAPEVLKQNSQSMESGGSQGDSVVQDEDASKAWRHPSVRRAVAEETDGKCAYCEGFVGDVSYRHIEHILPKGRFPELASEWSNLTCACQVCNTNKGEYYSDHCPLLNPYQDDPEEWLQILGPLIWPRPGLGRAELTVRKLGLNSRKDLFESRGKRLELMLNLVDRWHAASGEMKLALEEEIRQEARRGEFAATVLRALDVVGFPVDEEGEREEVRTQT